MKWSKVKILDNCFIGTNTVILPGVIIGPNCIAGANSTVSKDIPPNTICTGSPAKVICSIQEFVDKHKLDIYCATAEIALFIEWHIVCCLRTRDLLFAYITVS